MGTSLFLKLSQLLKDYLTPQAAAVTSGGRDCASLRSHLEKTSKTKSVGTKDVWDRETQIPSKEKT
jgi:hypothetical protein